MRTLFIDTETTGTIDARLPLEDDAQPHVCQFAAVLRLDGVEVSAIDLLVNPGIEIPRGASDVHGITTERARLVGVPESAVVGLAYRLVQACDLVVAHNFDFDWTVLRIAAQRAGFSRFPRAVRSRCTQVAATPVLNLPPSERMVAAGMKGPKTPKLSEAHERLCGAPLIGAHDALSDVRGCMAVHDVLERLGAWKEAA